MREAMVSTRVALRRDGAQVIRARLDIAAETAEHREALRAAARRGWAAVRAAFLREAPTTLPAHGLVNLVAVVVAASRRNKPADAFWVTIDRRINVHGYFQRKNKVTWYT